MNDTTPPGRAGRTLIKAFIFAGAILGIGTFGLTKTVMLLACGLGWITEAPDLGSAVYWVAGGIALGSSLGVALVKLRDRV